MRFKLTPRSMLLAALCICLMSVDMLLREGFAAQNSRIVFTSAIYDRRWVGVTHAEIFLMDGDGGNQERLTNNRADDVDPTWSPDRTKIAFVSDRNDGLLQIYVMDAHGKRTIQLTDGLQEKGDLDWSPDGKKIAFTSWKGPDGQNPRVMVMDADGNNAFKLTDGQEPSWSPNGRRIAFASGSEFDDQIFVIGVNGGKRERVTKSKSIKGTPAWSPDGKRIAYSALLREGTFQIYVIGADGRNQARLTHRQEHHMDPSWSPDGRTIAYVWSPDIFVNPPAKIRLMTADGEYIKQLSDDHRGNEYYPDFGPVSLGVSPTAKTSTTWGRLKILAPNPHTK